jgi:hypothetical protein
MKIKSKYTLRKATNCDFPLVIKHVQQVSRMPLPRCIGKTWAMKEAF